MIRDHDLVEIKEDADFGPGYKIIPLNNRTIKDQSPIKPKISPIQMGKKVISTGRMANLTTRPLHFTARQLQKKTKVTVMINDKPKEAKNEKQPLKPTVQKHA